MNVFIGGSRAVSKLNAVIRERFDDFIKRGCTILVGDANGKIGHQGSGKIDQRMGGLRQDGQRSGGNADHGLGELPGDLRIAHVGDVVDALDR